MAFSRLLHRRLRLQVGEEIGNVPVAHAGEGRIRKDGEVIGAVIGDALAQRPAEILEGPIADPGLLIGGDVRRVEDAERRGQRATAGQTRAVVLGVGVTAGAIRRVEDIGAALDRGWIGRGAGSERCQHGD